MKLKKILNIIYTGILLLLILFAGLLFFSKKDNALGVRTFAVLSGSMEPNISVGSLIITHKQDSYRDHDIVTANVVKKQGDRPTFLTHRIVKTIVQDQKVFYQTQGDANEDPDDLELTKDQIVGKVVVFFPYLGKLIAFMQTQTGLLILIIIPSTIIIYTEIINIKNRVVFLIKEKNKDKSKSKKSESKDVDDKESDSQENIEKKKIKKIVVKNKKIAKKE